MLALTAFVRIDAGAGLDLRAELKRRVDPPPRRLSSFMQLSLIGALDALSGAPAKPWRVALGTAGGATDNFAELIRNFNDGEQPMPLTFINSQSHIAGLYLAQIVKTIHCIEVGDTDGGGEEALLWQAVASSMDTLWGWVELETDVGAARSDWLRLEREPSGDALGWIDCEWLADPAPLANETPRESLIEWLARCLAQPDRARRRVVAAADGGWAITFGKTPDSFPTEG